MALSVFALTGCQDLFVASWGGNGNGQLGHVEPGPPPVLLDSSVPVLVDAGDLFDDKTVVQISAGPQNSCALTSDGAAACWGRSYVLMFDALTGHYVIEVSDPEPKLQSEAKWFSQDQVVTQITPGLLDNASTTSSGFLNYWGATTESAQAIGQVQGKTMIQAGAGSGHICGLTSEGLVACWGDNDAGQLGIGNYSDTPQPTLVTTSGVLAGKVVRQIQVANRHTCALTTDGTVACWGSNEFGQLGNGSSLDSAVPVLVQSGGALAGKTVTALSSGNNDHSCVVLDDGTAACWGRNTFGQLGDASTVDQPVPVAVLSAGALAGRQIADISAGGNHTCTLLDDETVACWGGNVKGQLGNGSNTDSLVPVAPQAPPGGARPVAAVSAGQDHTLALYRTTEPALFNSMAPRRVVDTRQYGGPAVPGVPIAVDLADVVPAGATAVTYNITATGQTASGLATVSPGGPTFASNTSTVNWSGGQQTIANGYVTKLSADRQLRLDLTSAGTAHLILDITGYFAPATTAEAGLFQGADRRVYDSRVADGPLQAGASRVLNINTGGTPFPVAPSAAALNVTATGTTGSGVLTVAKDRSTATSTVNWSGAAQTVANAVVTDVAANGDFTVTNNGGTPVQVVVDLTGTFAPVGAGATGAAFFPLDPSRTFDSRAANYMTAGQPLFGGQSRINTSTIPRDAVAAAINTTVTGTLVTGYLSVTPPGTAVPTTSTVNWFQSHTTRANGSFIPVEGTATRAYVGGWNSTHYVLDVAGYFK